MARDHDTADKTPRRGEPAGDSTQPPASTPVISLKLGELGRYQLLFELARGGMGTVFVGRLLGAHGFDRLVAIKRLHPQGADEEDIAAFLGEARLSAQIKHPNVVQTIELGEHEGSPFLVMELLEGVSLARLQQQLKDEGERLDPLLAAWIMSKVAAGLHAAHELRDRDEQPLGLVHRDVSPENVLLSYDGRVCVADFGVAKLSHGEHQTQSGIVKGKFAYMSPEQTKAKSLDRRSDVFSFGVVLHECLTGRRLFASKSAADTIRRVCEKRPADPRKRRPEVPGALAEIALRCLKKRRAQRYDDAGQLAVALRGVLRDHGSLDESDLSELLTRCFAAERSRLGTKIRRAIRVADGASDSVEAAVVEPSSATAGGSVTASVSTGPPLTTRPAGVWIGLGVALLLGAGIWWTAAGPGGGATTQESTTPSASVSAPTATSTTTERTSSSTNATASVLPTIHAPSSSQPASSSAQPPPIRQPSPPPSTNAQPSALPSPGPSSVPSASATSHKGVPFKKLDL